MPRYAAYSLRIESELDIPWFLEDSTPSGSCVLVRQLSPLARGSLLDTIGFHQPDRSVMRFASSCEMEVLDGTEVRVAGEAGVSDEELATYVAGVGMGVLQHQQGRLVLHASAVRGPTGAVAFVGGARSGKSTTAAALHFDGWPVITDDIAAFSRDAQGHLALTASFPCMKLWPDALRAVRRDPDEYPPIYAGADKRRVGTKDGFEPGTEKLAALYILGEGPRTEVADIARNDAFAELVRHSFAVRVLEDSGPQAWHVKLSAELVRETRIRRLLAPRGGASVIDDLVSAVNGDAAEIRNAHV